MQSLKNDKSLDFKTREGAVMIRWKFFVCLFMALALSSCASRKEWGGRLIQPDQIVTGVSWVAAEKKSDVSIRKLRQTNDASFQLVRLNTREKPHTHDRHDLTVFVLKGSALMHFGTRQIKVRAGDVIDIPRGTPHWVENRSKHGSEVFAVFTPAFDGKDTRYLDSGNS